MPVDRQAPSKSDRIVHHSAEECSCLLLEIARDDWDKTEPCPLHVVAVRAADSPRAACILASCRRDIPPFRYSQSSNRMPPQPPPAPRATVGHSRASASARRFRTLLSRVESLLVPRALWSCRATRQSRAVRLRSPQPSTFGSYLRYPARHTEPRETMGAGP